MITYKNNGLRSNKKRYVTAIVRRPGHSGNMVTGDKWLDDTVLLPGQSVSYCYSLSGVIGVVKAEDFPSLELSVDLSIFRD